MKRTANLPTNRSFFLFGARATGKTWLLRDHFSSSQVTFIDLLMPREYDELSLHPGRLSQRVASLPDKGEHWIVIDEVQKVPALLDMVHLEIEAHSRSQMGITDERPRDRKVFFALTGSSARKLKRGSANLLAGRALLRYLYPLISDEMPHEIELNDVLQWGALPEVIANSELSLRSDILTTYVHTYLREEILAEQLARETPPFRRFLEVAAQTNGEIVNFSAAARDIGVSPNTVQSYYQILEDTLLAYRVTPYHRSIRKRQRGGPKFYLFDCGVTRAMLGIEKQPITANTYGYGRAFEHFLFLEMYRRASYRGLNYSFSYLQTKNNLELDFVIDRPGIPTAVVEVKSADSIRDDHLYALKTVAKDLGSVDRFCLSLDPNPRIVDGITVLPWERGLVELGLADSVTRSA
jgi:uncharacterized protein